MTKNAIMIALLVGCAACGDETHYADSGFPSETGALIGVELDLPCDGLAQTKQGTIYWYAEGQAPLMVDKVDLCSERDIDILDPICIATGDYSVSEDGVIRVLCGAWTGTTADVADFVHVEGRARETLR